MNKLDITLNQFKKMKAVDRDEIIYQNLVHIKKKLGITSSIKKFSMSGFLFSQSGWELKNL